MGDLSVQLQALRYLAVGAYEHQEALGCASVCHQLIGIVRDLLRLEECTDCEIPMSDSPSAKRGYRADVRCALSLSLKTLVAVCEGHPGNQSLLLDTGGLQLGVHILVCLPGAEAVLVEALRFISCIVSLHSGRQALAAAGGLSAIIEAMQRHPASLRLQQEGCRIISQVAAVGDLKLVALLDWRCTLEVLREAKRHHPKYALAATLPVRWDFEKVAPPGLQPGCASVRLGPL
eukprot:TRINITY_DN33186_c0_g1_i1.p1 TRINITY_DN33186_c0_g1~~TRINITY_DN33186_c0_g1_i1.p1  ORF type:complete len:233 (+),score=31.75 TRINITY_DN33186_c0_g1_i1:418-1116(+)